METLVTTLMALLVGLLIRAAVLPVAVAILAVPLLALAIATQGCETLRRRSIGLREAMAS